MSQNDSCITITLTHAGSIRWSTYPYKKIHNTLNHIARKPKQYHCKQNSTESFLIHKKVHSEKGPKRIPFYLNPRYLVIAKKDLNLHSEKKASYSDKVPYYFAHKKLLSNYTDRFGSSENPGI